MTTSSHDTVATIREHVVGRRLSGVSFILDYIQLQFDPPPTINALTPVTVRAGAKQAVQGDESFRNLLCDQIPKIVTSVQLLHETALIFSFIDGSEISLSLRPADYVCPEAVNIYGKDHICIVI
jgi:hypothetical protein